MFGELSRLFDRNFAVGFFLPVFIWFATTLFFIHEFVHRIDLSGLQELDYLVFTTVFGLACLVGGIGFLAVNRGLYRLMEGYYALNPVKLFGWMEKIRYRRMRAELERLEDEYQTCRQNQTEFPAASQTKRDALVARLAVDFPEREDLLLATPFGNALRSFESYPRIMYGLDAIPGWSRLLTVVPREYFQLIEGTKAYVDLWVNLGAVFIFLQIEYVWLVFATGRQLNWWIVGLWIVLGTLAPLLATSAAREWGQLVKAAFDVFAPRLREALGIEEPANRQKAFEQWENVSRALIYRAPDYLPPRKK